MRQLILITLTLHLAAGALTGASSASGAVEGYRELAVEFQRPVSLERIGEASMTPLPTGSFEYQFHASQIQPNPVSGGVVSQHVPGPTAEIELAAKIDRILNELPGDRAQFVASARVVPIHTIMARLPVALVDTFRAQVKDEFHDVSVRSKDSDAFGAPALDSSTSTAASTSSGGWHGWAPDWGSWFFRSYGDIDDQVYRYKAFASISWEGPSELQQFDGNSDAGLEMNVAYYRHATGVEETASGDTSELESWATDFPGAYREVVKLDDDQVIYAIGTHEADKLRYSTEADPDWYEGYFVEMVIADRFDYYDLGNRRPRFTLYAQKDLDMHCGGAFADACFFSDAGHNFMGGSYDPFPVWPTVTWNYL